MDYVFRMQLKDPSRHTYMYSLAKTSHGEPIIPLAKTELHSKAVNGIKTKAQAFIAERA